MRTVASVMLAFGCLLAAIFMVPTVAAASGKARVDHRERAMVRGINHQRARYGLAAVRVSSRLAHAADYHSWEMLEADYFSHSSHNGESFDRRVRRFANHRTLGETLAMVGGCGRRSARKVVRMWMNSPGHRAILLSGKFRRIGVAKRSGSLNGNRACVVTADFASRK
jgi:uncharacterized protein YkwD